MSRRINDRIFRLIHHQARSLRREHHSSFDSFKVIDIYPPAAEAYLERATRKFIEENFYGAIEDYLRVIRLEPKNVVAYNNTGAAMIHLKEYHGAILYFNKAVELCPHLAKAYLNRGSAKDRLGNALGAISDYTKAIECEPAYGAAYNNRGLTYLKLQKPERARADFYKAIELHFPVSTGQLERCDELERPEEAPGGAPDISPLPMPQGKAKKRLRHILNHFGGHIRLYAGTTSYGNAIIDTSIQP